jgi:translation initiation factor 5A
MDSDYQFEAGDAGSAGIEKVSAGSLKKGDLVMIKGHPCKVVSFSTAKTGKHGSAKAMVSGIDIFTSNKYECTFSTGDNVDAPVMKRLEYTLVNIEDDGFVALMNDAGEMKEDLKLPEEEWLKDVTDKIKSIFEDGKKECIVVVVSAMGMEKIIAAREGKEQ